MIRKAERSRIRKKALREILRITGYLAVVFTGFSLISMFCDLPALLRYMFWSMFVIAAMVYVGRTIGELRPRDPRTVAGDLETRDESLSGRIQTAVDLAGYAPPGVSLALIRHHLKNAVGILRTAHPEYLLTSSITIPRKIVMLGAATVVFLWVSSGGDPLPWMRATIPALDPPPPPSVLESIAPGDTSVARGSSFTIRAVLRHGTGIPYFAARYPGRPDWNDPLSVLWEKRPQTGYTKLVTDIDEPFDYRITAGSDTSGWFSVDVFTPLRITGSKTRYTFPEYTGLGEYEINDFPDILQAVKGTRVTVSFTTNNDMVRCSAEYTNGRKPDSLSVSTHGAVWHARLNSPYQAYIAATDVWDQNMRIGPVDIRPLPDSPPLIHELRPGNDGILGKDMSVDLAIHASDDFGLSVIRIAYAYEGREGSLVLTEGSLGKEGTWTKTWMLSDLDLFPEDVIAYRFEVADNNTLTGPGISTSTWFHLRFPSLEEIITKIESRENDMVDSLQTVSDDARSIHEDLKELSMEMAGAEQADWTTRESLKSLAERQQELGERIGRIAEELASIEKQTEDAELVPVELLEKVSRVRELISELDMPEMRKALSDLQEAIENVDQKEMARSLARLSQHQETIMQSLDRATEFLERLLAAQELSHLAREAERLTAEHEAVMESGDQRTAAERGEKEQSLSEELGSLEQAAEEAVESLEELSLAAAESLAASVMREKQAQTTELLQSAGEQLRNNREQDAIPYQKQALDALQRFSAELQSIESDMGRGDNQRMREALMTAESVISELSVEQESLNNEPVMTGMTAAKQVGIADALRELRRKLEELFGPGMSEASGTLLNIMAHAQNDIDAAVTNLHTDSRLKHGRRSLSALNSLSAALASARDQMNNSSSCPTGMPTEDMFGLSQQQSGLNSMCQSMLPRADQLSQEALSAMAARQQWIRDQLSRLSEESGASGLLGDLGAIGGEMEDVIEELQNRGLDQSTVDSQRRILSRMLDAQRSIRRQGLARRRRSKPAEDTVMQAVPNGQDVEIDPIPGMAPPPRLDDRYPPMYQALIDAYFQAIQGTDE